MSEELVRKYINHFVKKAKWSDDEAVIETYLKMRNKLMELLKNGICE